MNMNPSYNILTWTFPSTQVSAPSSSAPSFPPTEQDLFEDQFSFVGISTGHHFIGYKPLVCDKDEPEELYHELNTLFQSGQQ